MFDYKTVVIGAGIEGSATAYYLAKNGQSTLLLEQFPLPHSRGSSHGQTRIIRRTHADVTFSNWIHDAYDQWHQLERETRTRLLDETGYLMLEKSPSDELTEYVSNLKPRGVPFEKMTADQARKRFAMPSCPEGYDALYEPGGGALKADQCLLAYQKMFVTFGGTIKDGEQVLEIVPGETVTVITNKATYRTSAIVITAGPWTSKLTVPLGLNLPLQPIRINVCYWKTNTDAYKAEKGQPVFFIIPHEDITLADGSQALFYGTPASEYPDHIKVCVHTGPNIDPDFRDSDSVQDSQYKEAMKKAVRMFFPEAEPTPALQESCIYTMTPDKSYILDRHPTWGNIVIGAGFSGMGFKTAPIIGQILGDMVLGRPSSYDTRNFRISRFSDVVKPVSKL